MLGPWAEPVKTQGLALQFLEMCLNEVTLNVCCELADPLMELG